MRTFALAIAMALVVASCGEEDDRRARGACGVTAAEFTASVEAADQVLSGSSSSASLSATAHARKVVDSQCLVGKRRPEVIVALGGGGDSYFLGADAFSIDPSSLRVVYADDTVSAVRIVQR